jgi:hypothetical protein
VRWREAVENCLLGVGIVIVVGCLRSAPSPTRPQLAPTPPACTVAVAPSLLCNRATKTEPRYECAICPDPARACLTETSIYCASSCDEPLCGARPAR